MKVQVSTKYKKKAIKAIFAVLLFIIVYFILLIFTIAISLSSLIFGMIVIFIKPMIFRIILGIVLLIFGTIMKSYLIKFFIKQYKKDLNHLTEITKNEEPKLFNFIEEITKKMHTKFPYKIYLSSEVNAAVFYNLKFWNMFIQVKKNLQIGLGLVNTLTEQEFMAILAHELAHFSQRSTKIGNYVYIVNQMIYNMLYGDEEIELIFKNYRNKNILIFLIFFSIPFKIIQGIQWILRKLYNFVNISYMDLLREMEFYADEIAAHTAGIKAFKESLLRFDLADYSLNVVTEFYKAKIDDNVISRNIFKEQIFVMSFLANENKIPFNNNLPLVTLSDIKRYNKSKLVIKDQWASHPSIEDRITALENLNTQHIEYKNNLAILLFSNKDQIQEIITKKVFDEYNFKEPPIKLEIENFIKEYTKLYNNNNFPKEYNGYYDHKNPIIPNFDEINLMNDIENLDLLFGKEKIEMIYDFIALENDINTLIKISQKEYQIKTFEYDGKKFNSNKANILIKKLQNEFIIARNNIQKHDAMIYTFFQNKALKKGSLMILKDKYINLEKQDIEFDKRMELYNNIILSTEFTNEYITFKQIESNFNAILNLESQLKIEIKNLIDDPELTNEISKDSKDNFEKYLSKEWIYFKNNKYIDENISVFSLAINEFYHLISRKYFLTKLDVLDFQIKLLY